MSFIRMMLLSTLLGRTLLLVSCKEETAEDKAKKGWKQLGEAAKQATEDAKEAIDEANK